MYQWFQSKKSDPRVLALHIKLFEEQGGGAGGGGGKITFVSLSNLSPNPTI